MRGITQAVCVYAAENNGAFPVVAYAPYSPSLNNPTATAFDTPENAIASYYAPSPAQAGSVPACFWILVLQGAVTEKQFICRLDPFVSHPGTTTNSTGKYFNNFQGSDRLSYSMAYPWKADGTVGNWWKDTVDTTLPIVADMTPLQGTGKPKRNVTPTAVPADPATWNSGNHQGDGQNVGFADGHAAWVKSPDCGQNNDNIYSWSKEMFAAPLQLGDVPATKSSPVLTADKAPFDILMLPVRDLNTGKL